MKWFITIISTLLGGLLTVAISNTLRVKAREIYAREMQILKHGGFIVECGPDDD